ncbi:MAG: hypothetical protein C0483_14840 [Pirellula sp.]|nr:hypothetical protein [Pirellula sp.]
MSTITMPDIADGLAGVPATLLMPLWARARESQRADPLLRDQKAAAIVQSLKFDFTTFEHKQVAAVDYCIRASIFDRLARDYLRAHPSTDVVEFGVGLDSRLERLDNGVVRWTELDFPEVIALRESFYAGHPRRTMLAQSLLDFSWFDKVQTSSSAGPLFVAEGVFYFLSEAEFKSLLTNLADRFPGASLIFDAQSPLYLRISNLRHPLSGSRLRFALKSAAELESWDPRFRVEQYVGFGDSPDYDQCRRRLSLMKRLGTKLSFLTREMFKVVQVRFDSKPVRIR